ncbi:hypothetical protein FKM82_003393 [Ascaphus truei]
MTPICRSLSPIILSHFPWHSSVTPCVWNPMKGMCLLSDHKGHNLEDRRINANQKLYKVSGNITKRSLCWGTWCIHV